MECGPKHAERVPTVWGNIDALIIAIGFGGR